MDSRINLREGLSIPQEKEFQLGGSCIPATPDKPVPTRSNLMPVNGHSNQLSRTQWQLTGFPNGHAQDASNYNRVASHFGHIDQVGRHGGPYMGNASLAASNGMFNHIADSHTQALSNGGAGWNISSLANLLAMKNAAATASQNRTLNRSMSMAGRTLIPNLHSQINNQRESNLGELLLTNRPYYSSSNLSSTQIPQYGLPIPCQPNYDLNSLPRIEDDEAPNATASFQFTPVVANPAMSLENNQLYATANLSLKKSSSEEKDKQQDLVISIASEANQHNSDELLHNIVESSSAVVSTPFKEPKDSDRGSEQGIDLNKTPQQKLPKRRKHRPKVIVEGKQKTPKAATTKITNSEEKPTEKRKYVRKKGLNDPVTQHTDSIGQASYSSVETAPKKSCRRAMKFDLEKSKDERPGNMAAQQEEMLNGKKVAFNLNVDFQVVESSNEANMICGTEPGLQISCQNGLLLEGQQSGAISNSIPAMNRMPSDFMSISERQAAAAAAQLAPTQDMQMEKLNAGTRAADTRMKQHIQTERIGQIVFLTKTNCKSLEQTGQLISQNTPQPVPKTSSYLVDGRGSKRDHCHIQRTGPCTTNRDGSSLLCQEIFQIDYYHQNGSIPSTGCSREQQTVEPTLSNSDRSGKGRMPQKQTDALKDHQLLSVKKRGRPAKQKLTVQMEEIISRMQGLNLNERSNEKQNALVPYKGDGGVVPYEGFNFIKKHRPRPKVDLDPETERVWKLLMGKEGSEGLGETEKDKEKWWEEERRVFRGRVDSFIARMHLVQGDRRFSKWKGSIVDSVIGVFLTQNVSDHLSSSAFMTLAAQFPPKSTRARTSEKDGTTVLVEEPDACMLNPQETIKWHEKLLGYPCYNHSSMTACESRDHRRDSETTWIGRTNMVEAHGNSQEEEVISSQDSFDSSIVQANGGVRSYSGSNSEAEDPAGGCKPNKSQGSSFTDLLHMESSTLFEEFYRRVCGSSLFDKGSSQVREPPEDTENGQKRPRLERLDCQQEPSTFNQRINCNNPQMPALVFPSSDYQLHKTVRSNVPEIGGFKLHGEESISSWPSTASRFSREKLPSSMSNRVRQGAEGVVETTTELHGPSRCQENLILDPQASLSMQSMQDRSGSQPYHNSQLHEGNKTFQLEGTSVPKPLNLAEALAMRQDDYRQHISDTHNPTSKVFDAEDRIALVDKQTQVNSINKVSIETNTNSSKARKLKAEGGKKDAVDWDCLRKEAQTKVGRKERNKDTMDSLNYEAIRCASVDEISQCIKARGMNNMLAERIKEFLNRLARDHGSIDLEWLRNVPPDKAKDYLLSIRGLGLKSVECVRLLTLHHLAFPVDTNVGRIAVRLGWVPLRPLPESLQIHLLELYPVLESIQKYLWPRLCKLDQRTLYELHYQMITFGKVFCTKSKPNCNACPMRAECRHFASAFASARFTLPGPEEKSIMTSTAPFTVEGNTGIVINPMPLPPSEDNSLRRAVSDSGSCLPIVEEPASPPEQECIEVTESNIEEMFHDDPEEIPTIKLSMEEFTANLQNYMQGSMELQTGDMSKALVALSPAAASIPTPKLKYATRLRTEHQVYELPDSHPLLDRMARREPDDPSPYLLAIWTPGETANSSQPPERQCKSQESDKLCNEKTCFSCNSIREADSQTVRGTILIPCRTAMRGSFPLNGTYFQVNEVFAHHESSLNPIEVPRAWLWNLPRRLAYFGTSVSAIFRGLSTEEIQYCFWKGFVCVRGFELEERAPRPLVARLHFPASKLARTKS